MPETPPDSLTPEQQKAAQDARIATLVLGWKDQDPNFRDAAGRIRPKSQWAPSRNWRDASEAMHLLLSGGIWERTARTSVGIPVTTITDTLVNKVTKDKIEASGATELQLMNATLLAIADFMEGVVP